MGVATACTIALDGAVGHLIDVQVDVSQGLAIAMVALIAVLPEYAVDAYLAWRAAIDGQNEALGAELLSAPPTLRL